MFDWTLKIEVDGQWETCRYSSQLLARNAYESILQDYGKRISQAQLVYTDGTVKLLEMKPQAAAVRPNAMHGQARC